MTMLVTGIGWVTAAGLGRGRTDRAFAMPLGPLPRVRRAAISEEPDQRFGRLDDYSRVGLAAVAFALKDASLEGWTSRRDIGIVAASRYGCLATDLAYFDTVMPEGGWMASPNLFAYTLPNSVLGEAALRFGLAGPTFVVTERTSGGVAALEMAWLSVTLGEADAMLAGICDLPAPPPYCTLPAEPAGAVFLVCERTPRPGVPPYGEITLGASGSLRLGGDAVRDLRELAACLLRRRDADPARQD